MKISRNILLFAILFVSPILKGQHDVQIQKNDFRLEKDGFNKAWDHIKDGDRNYDLGGVFLTDAIYHYKEALIYNPLYATLIFKLGLCYLENKEPEKAVDCFIQAREIDPYITDKIYLFTGNAYQLNGDFGKALDCYNIYSDRMVGSDDFDISVNKYIRECNTAIELNDRFSDVMVSNLGEKINSSEDDYSPVTTGNGDLLYFTSRRQINDKGNQLKSDKKGDENIFFSTIDQGNWGVAYPAGEELNSENNEGILLVDNDNEVMYIYAGWQGGGDIFISEYNRGKWSKPYRAGNGINSNSRETSIAISEDQNEIYFTSDRKNGLGGRDIYYIKRLKNNKWTKPYNLGPNINSIGNEESVWISYTGDTLWFSSNGRIGIGGYDIYRSFRDELGSWTKAENIGLPVNSQWNELFYRPDPRVNGTFYFSSDRSGGFGGFDIWKAVWNRDETENPEEHVRMIEEADTSVVIIPDGIMIFR